MPITTLNSQAIPADVIQSSDLDYPLTDFSSTGIDDNATSTAITIDASENVGIGTASPAQLLDVNGTAVFGGATTRLTTYSDSTYSGIFNGSSLTSDEAVYMGGDSIFFYGGGTERMRIDSSGNVLVGGTSQSGTANKVMVKSADKFGLSIIDTTAQATGVGGALNLGGNYRTSADAQAFTRIAALKDNSTDGNFAYSMGFYTTPNGGTFTERMRIDSSGRVGIGTSDPSSGTSTYYDDLVIKNATSGTGAGITIQSNTTNGFGAVEFRKADGTQVGKMYASSANGQLGFETGGAERMRIDSSGNVGIGTASPSSTLHLYGTGSPIRLNIEGTTGRVESRLDNTSGAFIFGIDDSGGAGFGSAYSRNIYSNGAYPMLFWTNNAERMRIDSSGNVGIGTNNPPSVTNFKYLAVHATTNAYLHLTNSTTGSTGSDGFDVVVSGLDASLINREAGNLRFSTSDTERMRIDSSGRVFIGKTSDNDNTAGHTLHSSGLVVHTRSSSFAAIFNRTTDDGDIAQFKKDGALVGSIGSNSSGGSPLLDINASTSGSSLMRFTTSGTERMRIDASGKISIGNNIPMWSGSYGGALLLKGNNATADRYAQLGIVDSTGSVVSTGLVVANGGLVGVNTTNPSTFFEAAHTTASVANNITTYNASTSSAAEVAVDWSLERTGSAVKMRAARITAGKEQTWTTTPSTVDGYLRFLTVRDESLNEAMRIDSSGRLIIGTTSPISTSALLSLYQTTGNVYGQAYCPAITNGEQVIFQAGARASGTNADRYCALSSYKHSGVTNAAPYLYLQEEDGNAAYYWTDNNGVLKYSNSAANVGTTGGGAVGAQTSDERLKTIEEGFEYGIETVKALTPIAYRRNDEESPERKLGFGAQTTQAIVPEVVFDTGDCLDGYDGEGVEATPKTNNTILGMEYVQLIPVLTKAIQEQQVMIEELKAEVAALKGA